MNEQSLFSLLAPDQSKPTVLAIVGPNGSGKSTIINLLRLTNVHIGDSRYNGRMIRDEATGEVLIPMVSPDEIAKVIRVQNPALSWDNCNKEAALTANHLREMLADAGFDFAFETVGSHYSKVDFLETLKDRGYLVVIIFISTNNVNININRVQQRYLSGGHDVPVDKIRLRFDRTMGLLPQYFDVSDIMIIFDNSKYHKCDDGIGPDTLLIKTPECVSITEQGFNSVWLNERLKIIL